MNKFLTALSGACAVLLALPATAAIVSFAVPLSGAQEVGGGDADGFGVALLAIDDTASTISWRIVAKNIGQPPTGAHIHNAAAGVNGPVSINFSAQLAGTSLFDANLAGVLANPANWYVNVHNAAFPGGAIRGQLTGQAPAANSTFTTFIVPLSGAQEVGGGDPDGFGTALLAMDAATSTVDWLIDTENIDLPPTGAHIHNAPAGVNGPVSINFSAQLAGTVIDTDVAGVLANPANWYVNVHNQAHPGGAIRGQLPAAATEVWEPATLLLVGAGLAGIGAARRRRR